MSVQIYRILINEESWDNPSEEFWVVALSQEDAILTAIGLYGETVDDISVEPDEFDSQLVISDTLQEKVNGPQKGN